MYSCMSIHIYVYIYVDTQELEAGPSLQHSTQNHTSGVQSTNQLPSQNWLGRGSCLRRASWLHFVSSLNKLTCTEQLAKREKLPVYVCTYMKVLSVSSACVCAGAAHKSAASVRSREGKQFVRLTSPNTVQTRVCFRTFGHCFSLCSPPNCCWRSGRAKTHRGSSSHQDFWTTDSTPRFPMALSLPLRVGPICMFGCVGNRICFSSKICGILHGW